MSDSILADQVDGLLKLQENEMETASIRSTLADVPRRLNLLSTQLEEFKARIADASARISDL